jgi:hypothetical protein
MVPNFELFENYDEKLIKQFVEKSFNYQTDGIVCCMNKEYTRDETQSY